MAVDYAVVFGNVLGVEGVGWNNTFIVSKLGDLWVTEVKEEQSMSPTLTGDQLNFHRFVVEVVEAMLASWEGYGAKSSMRTTIYGKPSNKVFCTDPVIGTTLYALNELRSFLGINKMHGGRASAWSMEFNVNNVALNKYRILIQAVNAHITSVEAYREAERQRAEELRRRQTCTPSSCDGIGSGTSLPMMTHANST